jgi:hypothetical protein
LTAAVLIALGASPRESTDGPANCAKHGVAAAQNTKLDILDRAVVIEQKLNI